MQQAIVRAIDIVLAHGDSFVLPPSYEIEIIRSRRDDVADLVARLYLEYPSAADSEPMIADVVLAPVGYTGYRTITQLDPVWNLYLLALVIVAGPEIERARVPIERGIVHSFRFEFRGSSRQLFDTGIGWHSFCDAGRERAAGCVQVLSTDICSFSQSICYRRLERALQTACPATDVADRIMSVVSRLSGGASFGLPVGAPAFSLLAELVLDATDRMLLANGVAFIRYIDDYRIFAESSAEAERTLLLVAELLWTHSRFSLQKAKTKILPAEEFLSRLPAPAQHADAASGDGEKEFMRLRMHVDRYADRTAAGTDALRHLIQRFDVVGLLAAQLRKPQVNESLAKRVVRSMAHVDAGRRTELMILLSCHLERFAPIFQSVVQSYLDHADTLDEKTRTGFADAVKALYVNRSYILQIPANQSWAIRVLARDFDERSASILADLYRTTSSAGIRRDIIIAMANGGGVRFLTGLRAEFSGLGAWERRAVIAALPVREDPETCWQQEPMLSGFEQIVRAWSVELHSLSAGLARLPL